MCLIIGDDVRVSVFFQAEGAAWFWVVQAPVAICTTPWRNVSTTEIAEMNCPRSLKTRTYRHFQAACCGIMRLIFSGSRPISLIHGSPGRIELIAAVSPAG